MRNRSSVAFVVNPLNVVAAICAAKAHHGTEILPMHVVIQAWPGLPAKVGGEIAEVVARLVKPFEFVVGVHLIDAGIGDEAGAAKAKTALAELPGLKGASELYFPHGIGLCVFDALLALSPRAERICTGDALGFLVDRKLHLGLLSETLPEPLGPFGKLCYWLSGGFAAEPKVADRAVAVLPVDQSGRVLKGIPLTVPPKAMVQEIFAACEAACTELRQHEDELLARACDRRIGLMITENHAEAGVIELDREVDLYCWAIRKYCVPGAVIFVKPHPGEKQSRTAGIAQRLPEFAVVPIDDRFARYPVELFRRLVQRSRAICMSYPSLSLRFLYGADVIQPMDENVIQKWFPERVWKSYLHAVATYDAPARNLAKWDGKSVLWAGRIDGALDPCKPL